MCDVGVIRKDYELINMYHSPCDKSNGAGGAGVRCASLHRSNLRILLGVFPERPCLPLCQQLAQLIEMLAMDLPSFPQPLESVWGVRGITHCHLG